MNKIPLSRSISDAFARPFTKDGLRHLLFSLLFYVLPFTFFISQGAAYSLASGEKKGIGFWTKLGFKMLTADVLYAGPAILFYGIYAVLLRFFAAFPLIIAVALFAAMGFFAIRALLIMPAANCCIALGAPLRAAVSAKEMKSVISGSFRRYVLSFVISLALLFVMGLVINALSLVPMLIAGVVFSALHGFITAGLYMNCCRQALGLPLPPKGCAASPGRGVRAAAFMLAFAILAGVMPVEARAVVPNIYLAEDIQPARPYDSAAGNRDVPGFYDHYQANAYARDTGLYNGNAEVAYNKETGTWYLRDATADRKFSEMSSNLLIHAADVGLDFVPVVGNVKNGIQAAYFGYKAITEDDPLLKQQYAVDASYKALGLALGGVSKVVKSAKAGTGALWLKTAIGAKNVKTTKHIVDATQKGLSYYDNVNNALKGLDIVGEGEMSEYVSPNGIVTVGKYFIDSAIDDAFTPRPSSGEVENVYWQGDPTGSGIMPDDYSVGTSGGTTQLDGPANTSSPDGLEVYEYGPCEGAYAISMPQIPGISYMIGDQPVKLYLYPDGTADFSCTLDITVKYEVAGAAATLSRSVTTVEQKAITPDRVETDQYGQNPRTYYKFSRRMEMTVTNSYAGEGFTDGGGNINTTSVAIFEVEFYKKLTDNLGKDTAVIGTITVKPLDPVSGAPAGNETLISFNASRMRRTVIGADGVPTYTYGP